ncbi:OmpA family protein [Zhouia spongiae]|uniref:OmpA family protein n=1 Tax=Zhouia spongiae TaxID=2202721 RepID=A0ABY3YKD8_9FLAO|nr:OmpA family protein [Zhouia spongiae]UNY98287.1 OmpA family protein [Zhouia spongiae]
MKKLLVLHIILISSLYLSAQSVSKADDYFNNYKFKEAIDLYHDIVAKSKEPKIGVIEKLADSYFNINDYSNAYLWYETLYKRKDGNLSETSFVKYVQSMKASEEYKKADAVIKEYYKDDLDRLKVIAAQKDHLDSLSSDGVVPAYTIYELKINTPYSDFGAAYYKGDIVFSSSRDTSRITEDIYEWNEQPYLDLFIAKRDETSGDLSDPEKFLNNMESSYHDATLTFSPDYKTVYFTKNFVQRNKLELNDKGVSNLQILKGEIKDNKIVNITPLKFNSPDYSCAHPTLSPDGNYLYFASDMPGGYGQTDIYVTRLFENGNTDTPVNLGPVINTVGREMFPFISGSTLYFASDSHYGLGGLDVFESKILENGRYSIPQNLGAPLNSNMDDFSFIINAEDNTGYFASNRSSGEGDDDIYSFKKKIVPATQTYSGQVLDEKTKEPVSEASIKIYDLFNEFISETMSESDGSYSITLTCASAYKVVFTKVEYSEKTITIETTEEPGARYKDKNVYLIPYESIVEKEGNVEKIKVNPIYFDYDKSDITQKAIPELEKVVFALHEFPNIKIKIESHTDSRGNDSYNMKLSDRRAKATQNYIVSRGVDPDRIESAIGYGETRLKNHCVNGIICSETEHSINRRSDFIIIEK